MKLFNAINYYLNAGLFSLLLAGSLIAAAAYYFMKVKKVAAAAEKINYLPFNKRNTVDYVCFDNIVSESGIGGLSEAGMFVIGDSVFISGLEVVGYNYDYASAGERRGTMIGAIALSNVLEEPVQLRQTVETVDISFHIDQLTQAKQKEIDRIVDLSEEYNQKQAMAGELHEKDAAAADILARQCSGLEKKIFVADALRKEAQALIDYENSLMKKNTNSRKINQILYSYTFNPDEYMEKLPKEQVYVKAVEALKAKENKYSSALEGCGCSCRALSSEKLAELVYRQSHPFTADEGLDRLHGSSYEELIVGSGSLFGMTKEAVEEEFMAGEAARFRGTAARERTDTEAMLRREREKLDEDSIREVQAYLASL